MKPQKIEKKDAQKRNNSKTILWACVGLIAAALAVLFFLHLRDQISTDDDLYDLSIQQAEKAKQDSVRVAADTKFLAALAAADDVVKLDGGVMYKRVSAPAPAGARKPTLKDRVRVDYQMCLPDGTVCDEGTDATFPLGGLIQGCKIAMPNMPVGEEWEIYIPQDKGYGMQGSGKIPGNSALVFKVAMKEIL